MPLHMEWVAGNKIEKWATNKRKSQKTKTWCQKEKHCQLSGIILATRRMILTKHVFCVDSALHLLPQRKVTQLICLTIYNAALKFVNLPVMVTVFVKKNITLPLLLTLLLHIHPNPQFVNHTFQIMDTHTKRDILSLFNSTKVVYFAKTENLTCAKVCEPLMSSLWLLLLQSLLQPNVFCNH